MHLKLPPEERWSPGERRSLLGDTVTARRLVTWLNTYPHVAATRGSFASCNNMFIRMGSQLRIVLAGWHSFFWHLCCQVVL